jgi:protoporphyrinogen IX oxidase
MSVDINVVTLGSSEPNSSGHKKAGPRALIGLLVLIALLAVIYLIDNERFYLWMTAAHVLAIISWMAGLLYLPRLFINHMDAPSGSDMSETFKGMEHRLLKIIMNPAMLLSWVFGLWLGYAGGHFAEGWFLAKLVAVGLMTASHMYFAKAVRLFAIDANIQTQRHWRIVNEVPTVLMIIIVVLVIVKPF